MFTLRSVEGMRLAAMVQRPVEDFGAVWQAFMPAMGELQRQGLVPRPVAVFQTSSLGLGPAGMAWYAAGLVVDEAFVVGAPFEELRVEGGPYAVWTYRGPFDGLPGAWGEFVGALKAEGAATELARPCFERYVDGGQDGGTPVTELYVPVRG